MKKRESDVLRCIRLFPRQPFTLPGDGPKVVFFQFTHSSSVPDTQPKGCRTTMGSANRSFKQVYFHDDSTQGCPVRRPDCSLISTFPLGSQNPDIQSSLGVIRNETRGRGPNVISNDPYQFIIWNYLNIGKTSLLMPQIYPNTGTNINVSLRVGLHYIYEVYKRTVSELLRYNEHLSLTQSTNQDP